MSIKHKVLQDFQFVQPGKKIIILKAKTVLEDYAYQTKTEVVIIPKSIVDSNPEFFSLIDWKMEFHTYIKSLKIPQPTIISKKIIPFIETLLLESNPTPIDNEDLVNQIKEKDNELIIKNDEISKKLEIINLKDRDLQNAQTSLQSKDDEIVCLQNTIETLQNRIIEIQSEKQSEVVSDDYVLKSKIIGIVDGFKKSGYSTEIFDSLINQI